MNAIETNGLSKMFHGIYAVHDLNMRVPQGSIYGFIGENGSGKTTAEKLMCGLLTKDGGDIRLFGKHYADPAVRARIGVLIDYAACFPNNTVYQNLMMQALNLNIKNPEKEVGRVLKLVRMVGSGDRKFKNCSLGMQQRIGVASALLGKPRLLILDEPINGLDVDGMRIIRETLTTVNQEDGVTILISSHIFDELSKIATHYGVIRDGQIAREMTADEMRSESRSFVFVKTLDDEAALTALTGRYREVERKSGGLRVYGEDSSAIVSGFLHENGVAVSEIAFNRIGLEEFYNQMMAFKGGAR